MLALLSTYDTGTVLVAAVVGLAPLCALACGLVARLKRRNIGVWLLLGFAFGPLALLVVAFMPAGSEPGSAGQASGP